ncbi:hypothetical protein J4E93_000332 [Alternaria ventricosa]|uniref:uncharacterized protein n=1 Tax=Alternaria ventricosa TaxID=1187951 RepID=UPI0020C2B88D|nr:uncharacterized protein J4E93_000332 [Alternaria ventricosa]KAI4655618.1 hypothetical protein J4E93_000332 [Alternaria ventricosa]
MLRPTRHSVLASVLATIAYAQSSSDSDPETLTCDDLSDGLAYNASVTHNTTALTLSYLGSDSDPSFSEDNGINWQISSYIGPYIWPGDGISENDTQAVLWLDVGESDIERLGNRMGFCHNVVPLQDFTTSNLTWSRQVLERAQDDNGDCKTMLGEECVQALQNWYSGQNSVWISQDCSTIKHTIPSECEGMLAEAVTVDTAPFNASDKVRIWEWARYDNETYTEEFTVPTCDDRNLSSGWGNRLALHTDYDVALNFPIVDILNFYPTTPVTNHFSTRSTPAKVVCLKPGNVQDGSRAPRSVKEVLDEKYGSQDGEDSQDDESSAERAFGRSGRAVFASMVGTIVGVWLGL